MPAQTQVAPATFTILDTTIRIINGLYSLNDLHKAAGGSKNHQPANFLRLEQTQALIAEITSEIKATGDQSSDLRSAVKVINGGNNRGTYVCQELVCAYANWISAAFYLRVIRFFLDYHKEQKALEPPTLTREQWGYLYQGVMDKCQGKGKFIYRSVFGTLKRHFGVAKCEDIKQSDFVEACNLLEIPVPDFAPKKPSVPAHIAVMDFDTRRDGEWRVYIRDGKAYRLAAMYATVQGDPYAPREQA